MESIMWIIKKIFTLHLQLGSKIPVKLNLKLHKVREYHYSSKSPEQIDQAILF